MGQPTPYDNEITQIQTRIDAPSRGIDWPLYVNLTLQCQGYRRALADQAAQETIDLAVDDPHVMDFKIGDRVKVVGDEASVNFVGEIGTIKFIDTGDGLDFGVEFDTFNIYRHELNSAPDEYRVPHGFGYWFDPEQLSYAN